MFLPKRILHTDRHIDIHYTDEHTDIHYTDEHTYIRTDICNYKVASLLKKSLKLFTFQVSGPGP